MEQLKDADYIECFDTIIPHCKRYDETVFFKTPVPFYHRNIHNIQPLFNSYISLANELKEKINKVE